MNLSRRQLLGWSVVAADLVRGQQKQSDEVIATATQDTTPRVGVVLSSFAEGSEHDGSKLEGLSSPKPADAELGADFFDGWVRKAIEMGSTRTGDLSSLIGAEDWVVIKTNISTCHGLDPSVKDGGAHQPYMPGTVTDLRVVRAVISYLVDKKCGARITIAEGSEQWLPVEKSKSAVDGWTSEWGGAFDGLSYRKMVADFSSKNRGVRFEIADLNSSDSIELPVPGKAIARNNPGGTYSIGKVIQQCDKLISIAPLKTDARTGVGLTFSNYAGIASGAKYGFPKDGLWKLGNPDEVVVDLFSYHPADFCFLGGPYGVEGDGPDGPGAASVHHNLLVTGTKAASVDAVAAMLMGFSPQQVPYLVLAEKMDYGATDTDIVWTRGDELEKARRVFRQPSRWKPAEKK